jgi:hypothetical protein
MNGLMHCKKSAENFTFHQGGEKGLVLLVELGRHTRRRLVDETVRPLLVEPDHPVPQRLTIYAANLRRVSREAPSGTAAIAKSRRAWPAFLVRWASRRSSPLV